jgi:hypothetical protein
MMRTMTTRLFLIAVAAGFALPSAAMAQAEVTANAG